VCVCVCVKLSSLKLPPPTPQLLRVWQIALQFICVSWPMGSGGRSSLCFVGEFILIVRMLGLHTLIYSSAYSNIMTLHSDFVVLSNLSGESGAGGGFDGSTSVVQLPLSLL